MREWGGTGFSTYDTCGKCIVRGFFLKSLQTKSLWHVHASTEGNTPALWTL